MEVAQHRIENWNEGEKLDLSNLGLTEIPENLPQSLQELHLYRNQITEIPETLPQSLRKMWLDNNQITEIPDNLPQSLQELDLKYNQITKIPDNLPQSLQRLHLRNNKITEIPKNLPQSLGYLWISDNEITEGYGINGFYQYDHDVYIFDNQQAYSKFYQLQQKHKTKQIIKIQKWWKSIYYRKHERKTWSFWFSKWNVW